MSANHLASIFAFAYIMLGTVQTGGSQNQKNQSVGKEEHGFVKKKDTTAFDSECFHMHTVFGTVAHRSCRGCVQDKRIHGIYSTVAVFMNSQKTLPC